MTEKTADPNGINLTGHLEELRTRILYSIIYFICGTVVGIFVAPQLLDIIKIPAKDLVTAFIITKPADAVIIYFKISLYAGLIISVPFILFEGWKFVKPAFSSRGAPPLINWLLPSAFLFAAGTVFTYFVIIPAGLKFLMNLTVKIASPMITLNSYVSFVLALMLLGGIVFQMPVLSALLTKAGIITPELMRKKRREAALGMLIVSAVVTPTTDVFNMALFVLPMLALYEISIITSALVYKTAKIQYPEEAYLNE